MPHPRRRPVARPTRHSQLESVIFRVTTGYMYVYIYVYIYIYFILYIYIERERERVPHPRRRLVARPIRHS